ncbi:MAG: transposase [Akkermansiaceae bacterium]|nr:transposase [Akkermansiaceae bacterium]
MSHAGDCGALAPPPVACPQRRGNTRKVDFHKGWYRSRHEVENFFQRIKRMRRIATRYDKLAMVFMNFILLAVTLDWIQSL